MWDIMQRVRMLEYWSVSNTSLFPLVESFLLGEDGWLRPLAKEVRSTMSAKKVSDGWKVARCEGKNGRRREKIQHYQKQHRENLVPIKSTRSARGVSAPTTHAHCNHQAKFIESPMLAVYPRDMQRMSCRKKPSINTL